MYSLSDMKITANRLDVLKSLLANREEHSQIVAEARVGYVQKAKEALASKLDELQSGKIAALTFNLVTPADHSKDFDQAIRMLEMHTGDTIEVDGSLIRSFVMNEWDWMSSFLASNSRYSATAASKL